MKDRLQLAKEFLNESGIINISIGDTINSRNRTTSTAYLQILCNTIFGEDNYIATFVRKSQASPRHDIRHIANAHDYILTYAKNIKLAKINKKLADTSRLKYEDKYVNTRGKFDLNQLDRGSKRYSQSLDYSINIEKDEVIEFFDGTNFKKIKAPERIEIWPGRNPKDKKWIFTWSKEKVKWGIENGYIVFRKDKNGQWKVYYKEYELVDNCGKPRKRTIPYSTLILDYQNEFGTAEIQNFFGTKTFDYAKPSGLIKHILQITSNSESLILDFFAGSGTTAHAVIRLNKEDGGKRKFILIEMEDYFYTIIIPRIKKLSYSLNWKNGKPKTIDGIGIFFKYCELE